MCISLYVHVCVVYVVQVCMSLHTNECSICCVCVGVVVWVYIMNGCNNYIFVNMCVGVVVCGGSVKLLHAVQVCECACIVPISFYYFVLFVTVCL